MQTACLTCLHARKVKTCGMGQALCSHTGETVSAFYCCGEFSHFALKTPASVASVPSLDGVENPMSGVSAFRSGSVCNTRTLSNGLDIPTQNTLETSHQGFAA